MALGKLELHLEKKTLLKFCLIPGYPITLFRVFFLEDKTSAPDVFSSCSFTPRADFETSLVMVNCYGYETWRHK